MIYSNAGNFQMFWHSDYSEAHENRLLSIGKTLQGGLHLPTPQENHDRAKAWLKAMEKEAKDGER